MQPKLTIGMATYDDFNGVYFTIQALRVFHSAAIRQCELIVVDNNPGKEQGEMVKTLVSKCVGDFIEARYIPCTENIGTSHSRDKIFREAKGEAVLCLDCHVLLYPHAIERLIEYYANHPKSRDLLQGPLMYDELGPYETGFADVWRGGMWGVWERNEAAGAHVAPHELPAGKPFEIGAMGLGLFSCRKDAWLGFNPLFTGFGGEEWYIHTKFRQADAKCWCLPWLRWVHRFGRPGGAPYPLDNWHRVRNYVIGHQELGLDIEPIGEHFIKEARFPADAWEWIKRDPIGSRDSDPWRKDFEARQRAAAGEPPVEEEKKSCSSCADKARKQPLPPLGQLYDAALNTASDINEHVPKLRELASKSKRVVEFGMRHGVSTVALLAGQPEKFTSIDVNRDPMAERLKTQSGVTEFNFIQGDSLAVDIDECDLLFIDTKHNAAQLAGELARHAAKVTHWIALHDTQIYGEHGDDGGPGLLHALRKFLRDNPEWSVVYHVENNYGFTVISKDPADKPPLPSKITMGLNFTKAVAKHLVDGNTDVSEADYQKRLEVCTLCDLRNGEDCSKCGCPLLKKAKWRSEQCPLGKWPAITEPTDAAAEVAAVAVADSEAA